MGGHVRQLGSGQDVSLTEVPSSLPLLAIAASDEMASTPQSPHRVNTAGRCPFARGQPVGRTRRCPRRGEHRRGVRVIWVGRLPTGSRQTFHDESEPAVLSAGKSYQHNHPIGRRRTGIPPFSLRRAVW